MHDIANLPAVQIFLGTFPMLAVLIWNVIEVRDLRKHVNDLSKRLSELAERVARIEGKIEGKKLVLVDQ